MTEEIIAVKRSLDEILDEKILNAIGKYEKGPLHYNELKVKNGMAEVLLAQNYLKDAERLSLSDKLSRLEDMNALNEYVEKRPSMSL
jgi:hypothetical protein